MYISVIVKVDHYCQDTPKANVDLLGCHLLVEVLCLYSFKQDYSMDPNLKDDEDEDWLRYCIYS